METNPIWIRLHSESIDATLAIAVQARIHDPLWLLGRQWQFGELRHDAGATPIDVRIEGTSAALSRLRGQPADATLGGAPIDVAAAPLEALVEREAVVEQGLDNLRLRTEGGLQLLRLLRAAGLGASAAFWVEASPFVMPEGELDSETREWLDLIDGRVPDGGRLAAAINDRLTVGGMPSLGADEEAVLRTWLAWAATRFDVPADGPSTWDPEHIEYTFAVAAPTASGDKVLAVPEYVDGRLDWYHFEQTSGSLGATGQATPLRFFRIPAPLDFAGMPNPRFWTFEDPGVRFDTLDVLSSAETPPSPATLMVLDFALSYSDDWFLLPLALDAWTAFEPTHVAVTDVFGETTFAQPPAGRWNMFRLEADGQSTGLSPLFLVATPIDSSEGLPVEEVHFLRDEVANIAWAVERTVPHSIGHGAAPTTQAVKTNAPTPSGLAWTLTPPSPPGNWFPLLPVTIGRLALGTLWNAREQEPAGQVLEGLRSPRRLHQEEVPPEGVQVDRRWQSARGIDGSLHFWIGRRKTPRRTDIAPAVRFDVVEWR